MNTIPDILYTSWDETPPAERTKPLTGSLRLVATPDPKKEMWFIQAQHSKMGKQLAGDGHATTQETVLDLLSYELLHTQTYQQFAANKALSEISINDLFSEQYRQIILQQPADRSLRNDPGIVEQHVIDFYANMALDDQKAIRDALSLRHSS